MTSTEIAQVLAAIGGLREEVGSLRGEVGSLGAEVGSLRTEVASLRAEQLAFQEHVAKHFGQVYARLGSLEARQDSLEAAISRQSTFLEEVHRDFKAFGEDLEGLDRRLAQFREDLSEEIRDLRKIVSGGFRDWGRRVTALEESVRR